ncbi:hypothetical protein E1176_02840 [Fulvivirga sp. RKSG066]|uniref:hypothetical protein n=1 Tax=Fulvivirga aurantia TaxID=2529383 RepID=UPI0012BD6894|nr:hypothetical protein [Fulvivirga aurantia]MTI19948.1 hypothetical protein [Fulvivirga aurantia]
MIRILFTTIIAVVTAACNQASSEQEYVSKTDTFKSPADNVTLKSGDAAEKKISQQTLENIEIFNGKRVNEEILTIGNIDGIGKQDTIRTYIIVQNDTVYVKSRWIRKNDIIWQFDLADPYLYLSDDNPLFEYEKSPVWTRLTIAKNYTVPELTPVSQYEYIDLKWVISSGLHDLKANNVNIDSTTYKAYLDNFKGMLVGFGDPEIRKLAIWHEPSKRFVSYYTP